MVKPKKHTSKQSKEVFGIALVSKSEENQFGPLALEFDESKYEIWESGMESNLQAKGYDVWHSVVSIDMSTN